MFDSGPKEQVGVCQLEMMLQAEGRAQTKAQNREQALRIYRGKMSEVENGTAELLGPAQRGSAQRKIVQNYVQDTDMKFLLSNINLILSRSAKGTSHEAEYLMFRMSDAVGRDL